MQQILSMIQNKQMSHQTEFRPFHQYQSYYPYYLPSYYSRFYPSLDASGRAGDGQVAGEYDRYFEPTTYWLEKRQPVIEETKIINDYSPPDKMMSNYLIHIFMIVLFALLLFKIFY